MHAQVVVAVHRILVRTVLSCNKAEAARTLQAHIGITDVLGRFGWAAADGCKKGT
jgi:hypothetical protein